MVMESDRNRWRGYYEQVDLLYCRALERVAFWAFLDFSTDADFAGVHR